MTSLSMKELVNLLETSSLEDLLGDERILQFADDLDEAGTNIMNGLGAEMMVKMSRFLRCMALSLMYTRGNFGLSEMLLMSLDENMSILVTIIMKLSIGLAVTEELR